MTASEIAADLRAYTGAGVISVSELAKYLGYKAAWRVSEKFLRNDKSSAVPIVGKLGTKYFIKDVAIRIHEHTEE